MKNNKVIGVPYNIYDDSEVQFIKFAESMFPKYKIRQDQTGMLYDIAIDIEGTGYTYTKTNIPINLKE